MRAYLSDIAWRWRSHSAAARLAWVVILAYFALSFVWMAAPHLTTPEHVKGLAWQLALQSGLAVNLLFGIAAYYLVPAQDRMGRFMWGLLIVLTLTHFTRRGACSLSHDPWYDAQMVFAGAPELRSACERAFGHWVFEYGPVLILVALVAWVGYRIFWPHGHPNV